MREKLLLKISNRVWSVVSKGNRPYYCFTDYKLVQIILKYCQRDGINSSNWTIIFIKRPKDSVLLTYEGVMKESNWSTSLKDFVKKHYNE